MAWRRTKNDPFAGQWEHIAAWIMAHPERSGADILRQMQRREPGRYLPSHLRTLERGVRKIRSRFHELLEAFQQEQQRAQVVVPQPLSQARKASVMEQPPAFTLKDAANERRMDGESSAEKAVLPAHLPEPSSPSHETASPAPEAARAEQDPLQQEASPCVPTQQDALVPSHATMTIAQGIAAYVQMQQRDKRQPKTVEWHQTALALLEQYLRTQCQCVLVSHITDGHICQWVAWLGQTPTERGVMRATSTIESYVRSARAWCQWLVSQHELTKTPFASLTVPKGGHRPLHPIEPEEWEQLLVACQTAEREGVLAEQMRARNKAMLWILFETGMHVSELCDLRLGDVNLEEGSLRVRGPGGHERRCILGAQGAQALREYVEKRHFKHKASSRNDKPLFVSERGQPLTANAFVLVFGRLKKRAGIRRKDMVPSLLRDSFAVRYLHLGGDPLRLRDVLGRDESAVVRRFVGLSEQVMKSSRHRGYAEVQRE